MFDVASVLVGVTLVTVGVCLSRHFRSILVNTFYILDLASQHIVSLV